MTEQIGASISLSASKRRFCDRSQVTVIEWIVAERKRLGWSQRDLAVKLGLSRGAVGQWESGASKPTLANLLSLAGLFGASVAPLIGPGTDYPGELVEQEDELTVLHAWREIEPDHRATMLEIMRGIAAPRQAHAAAPTTAVVQSRGKRIDRR